MMTKKELIERLKKEKIPADSYCLEGGLPHDRYCLKKTFKGWEVYYSEMGHQYEVTEFLSEEEACEYFYNELIKMLNYM